MSLLTMAFEVVLSKHWLVEFLASLHGAYPILHAALVLFLHMTMETALMTKVSLTKFALMARFGCFERFR